MYTGHVSLTHADYFCIVHNLGQESFQRYSVQYLHVMHTGHVSLTLTDYFCTVHSLGQESFQRYNVQSGRDHGKIFKTYMKLLQIVLNYIVI